MRVLTRKAGEAFMVGPSVKVTVLLIRGDRVKLSIKAPEGVLMYREEVIKELNVAAQLALTSAQASLAQPTLPAS
jgi:carbon storage regulator CsrA